MFTGIIEATGLLQEVTHQGRNLNFWIASSISDHLKIDQSLAHNGVCLTVVAQRPGQHLVTAVEETLSKTTLSKWNVGMVLNLERALRLGDRLDGHLVQGHVDAVAECISKHDEAGSTLFRFRIPGSFAELIVEKGSICLNGVSLTIFNLERDTFSVAIIPYTMEHTGFSSLSEGDSLNVEFDILGKYLLRQQALG
ncbi:MAG: riboflavin synthase [Bacteroidetes bacterium]|nr:riboflavin synthase [Bacteroidota bacterium]MBS1629019.1 riboflavin synthase [Bacteroidota bacterium]